MLERTDGLHVAYCNINIMLSSTVLIARWLDLCNVVDNLNTSEPRGLPRRKHCYGPFKSLLVEMLA